jgi:hypothetical protein
MSNAGQDDHVKQAAVAAKDVVTRAMDASKTVGRSPRRTRGMSCIATWSC